MKPRTHERVISSCLPHVVYFLVAASQNQVRPAGISKAAFLAKLLEDHYGDAPPDFVLCVGDDASDEKSYTAVKRFMRGAAVAAAMAALGPGHAGGSLGRRTAELASVAGGAGGVYFTATVGKKPTVAD